MAVILDRHSDLSIPVETSFFFHPISRMRIDQTSGHEELWRAIPPSMYLPGLHAARPHFERRPATPRDLLDTVLQSYARENGASRWGEKSPWHLRRVDEILRWYPKARIIGMVRDGRDCVASCRRSGFLHNSTRWYASTWRAAIRMGRRLAARYPDNYMEVRFEDLLRAPETVTRAVDAHVGLEFEPRQLDPASKSHAFDPNEEPWKKRAIDELDTARIGSWKQELSPGEVSQIEPILGPTLRSLGYAPTPPRTDGRWRRTADAVAARLSTARCFAVLTLKTLLGRL